MYLIFVMRDSEVTFIQVNSDQCTTQVESMDAACGSSVVSMITAPLIFHRSFLVESCLQNYCPLICL
ncbi:hypothetical protein XENTR_v10000511 [Xenopus tropicalis]|nr:hypothetical protein XENTR_v10000511 [Xenopus tropicalis]